MIPDILRQGAPQAAPQLIGWQLRAYGVTGTIAEVEAYHGEDDLACHASKGRTPRTQVLYAAPGTLYVYLCYGLHHLLNLVTDRDGVPSAVLIRGLLIDGVEPRRSNGPGKVAQLLGLDRRHHGQVLGTTVSLLPPPSPTLASVLRCGPRIGVDYAGPTWAEMPWRWWRADFPAVRHHAQAAQQPAPVEPVPVKKAKLPRRCTSAQ